MLLSRMKQIQLLFQSPHWIMINENNEYDESELTLALLKLSKRAMDKRINQLKLISHSKCSWANQMDEYDENI